MTALLSLTLLHINHIDPAKTTSLLLVEEETTQLVIEDTYIHSNVGWFCTVMFAILN